ncbi:hypothetical protein GLOIN_2v1844256 [Rhizophagus irregularis DAOM 181602=DAOM 197198]|uniref:Uncharacterized protein n=1 Tax=Rhizophagus irregularis (strain DAOM 181602 / DAOM 197198 / MUCL 43194) TaxID=747089 RepID=A0A2P4PLM2_RHIID|nr:hypothetical protein GLOIN_2v1844256 [Rhizophagus irregularis DAOM 181602=DAOM 197198]POG66294.1 hypothetical protein GLOIN_2v1844256 [Rhizophagus irregularis DAOM 181602=DAOM 197198]|eukprot:XP_025173160.1 hypothetical protein GLOIN_2v1844256 [Rhizophagus irregularis DAOM 181602=DAOM 197198]
MVKELLKRSIRLVGKSLKEYYLSRRVSESQFGNIKATEFAKSRWVIGQLTIVLYDDNRNTIYPKFLPCTALSKHVTNIVIIHAMYAFGTFGTASVLCTFSYQTSKTPCAAGHLVIRSRRRCRWCCGYIWSSKDGATTGYVFCVAIFARVIAKIIFFLFLFIKTLIE